MSVTKAMGKHTDSNGLQLVRPFRIGGVVVQYSEAGIWVVAQLLHLLR